MKYNIIWSKDAGEEFIEIISWYKYNAGKTVAQKTYAKINSQIKKLKDMPGMGKQVQILKDIGINDYRQIVQDHWILYYKTEGQCIHIISVIDGRRNLEEILYKKIIDGKIK
ncbi:type II toxin-antitoxin system RelE/ParE family toxin [Treponema sp. TIM-1]|uniref:type II toxin-antitoxin system RelE/ParE family toxin n=1 Tax=Treponema sp. TIM-1 TaxID=2898417 RepID=UPI00398151D5